MEAIVTGKAALDEVPERLAPYRHTRKSKSFRERESPRSRRNSNRRIEAYLDRSLTCNSLSPQNQIGNIPPSKSISHHILIHVLINVDVVEDLLLLRVTATFDMFIYDKKKSRFILFIQSITINSYCLLTLQLNNLVYFKVTFH